MAFFDYNRDGKKDWKDNAREYYLYNKFKEEEEENRNIKKKNHLILEDQMLDVVVYYCVSCFCFLQYGLL